MVLSKKNFPQIEEGGFKMIQVPYMHCVLYFCYYYYFATHNKTIVPLTVIKNPWELRACFSAPGWSPLAETVTHKVFWICPVYSVILFWSLSLKKTIFHKDRMLEMEAAFQGCCKNLRIFCLDFNTEHTGVWHCLKQIFKATIIQDLK